jgi:transposase-like protein
LFEPCYNHHRVKAVSTCHHCGLAYCEECLTEGADWYYCNAPECQAALEAERLPENYACPSCKAEITLSLEERTTHRFRCPSCGKDFVIHAVEPESEAGEETDEDPTAALAHVACPECGQTIALGDQELAAHAVVCPGCDRLLDLHSLDVDYAAEEESEEEVEPDVICPSCDTPLALTEEEIASGSYVCPLCNETQKLIS